MDYNELCARCGKVFTQEEYDDRHTDVDEYDQEFDVHSWCCTLCNKTRDESFED